MPGIITHLVSASRYLRLNQEKDFKKFILGTTFPDIRYIAKLDRDLTHKKFKPNLNFTGLDSFKAGWKLHIYIDRQWSKIVRNSKFYERYSNDKTLASVAAKIIEDKLDFKKIDDIGKYLKVLKNPGSGTALHIPREKIKFYYSISADYLMTKNYRSYIRHIFKKEAIEKILNKIEEMKHDKELVDFLAKMVEKMTP